MSSATILINKNTSYISSYIFYVKETVRFTFVNDKSMLSTVHKYF